MNSPQPPRMPPIQRLPFELRAQIARELCDFDLYDQRNYQIDPSGDTFFNGHTYEWQPLQKAGDKPQLSFQPVYDDLRALSLVSKDFRDPAQRALFAIVIVGDPTAYFKLLRTLLESPEVRSYIRCFLAIFVRNPDLEERCPEIERSRWAAFADILVPLVFDRYHTRGLHNKSYFSELQNELHSCGKSVALSSYITVSYRLASQKFCRLLTEVLNSVFQLCLSLRAFHLLCTHWSWWEQEDSRAFWPLSGFSHLWSEVLDGDPLLTTLTIDVDAVEAYRYLLTVTRKPCTPHVEHLTIIGSATDEMIHNMLGMAHVFDWVNALNRLKTLRIWNVFVQNTSPVTHNWNKLLLKFKATLEQLVVDDTRNLLYSRPDDILGPRASRQDVLFGSTLLLSCLPEMEKLRYLSVPIQYLRRCPEDMEPLEILIMPDEGQDVRQVVEADVKFPKSLERAEILMVQEVEDNLITEVKALRIDLGKNGHTTGQIV